MNHSGYPAYRVFADQLREKIISGELPVGAVLPSPAQAAQNFGATRSVAKRAMELLCKEGFAVGRRGKGVFVRDRSKPLSRNLNDEVSELQETLREVLHRLACIEDALADRGM